MFNWFCSGGSGGLPLLQRETRQMKTLVNKTNPQIRITAPEEAVKERPSCWAIWPEGYKGCRSLLLDKDNWTLVEEESKHTEVWVEGRTIFEQDAKKPEVDLEQAAIDDGMRCYKRGFVDGKEWQKKQEPTWKKTEPEPNMSYVLCFKGGGVIDTCDYRERTKRFYYEDGEYNSSVPYNSDTLIGWMYRLELEKLPKQ